MPFDVFQTVGNLVVIGNVQVFGPLRQASARRPEWDQEKCVAVVYPQPCTAADAGHGPEVWDAVLLAIGTGGGEGLVFHVRDLGSRSARSLGLHEHQRSDKRSVIVHLLDNKVDTPQIVGLARWRLLGGYDPLVVAEYGVVKYVFPQPRGRPLGVDLGVLPQPQMASRLEEGHNGLSKRERRWPGT